MNDDRHIDRSKVQFDFLVDEDSTRVPEEEITALGGRVFRIPPYQHPIRYRRELIRLMREQQWPIVHSNINTLSVFPLSAAEKVGVPVRIAHSHSTMGKGEFAKNVMKLALRPFANVYPTVRFACSHYAGEWLFGKNADFTVIPNGIELDKFRFDSVIRQESSQRTWDCRRYIPNWSRRAFYAAEESSFSSGCACGCTSRQAQCNDCLCG